MSSSIEQILDNCQSEDKGVRDSGEAALSQLETNVPAFISALMNVLVADSSQTRRQLAAVLIRKAIGPYMGPPSPNAPEWVKLSAEIQAGLRAALLLSLSAEKVGPVSKQICHIIAIVASKCAGDGFSGWPEMLPTVFSLANNPDETQRALALFLFKQLVDYCDPAAMAPHAASLKAALATLLRDSAPRVATVALSGATSLIITLKDESMRKTYLELMPLILKALERALAPGEAGDEDAAQQALRSLIEVVQEQPLFMRDFLEPAAMAMLSIINHTGFEDDTRVLGLEFLVCLAEQAGATVRRFPPLVAHVLTMATRFLTEVEEDPSWCSEDNDEDAYTGDGGDGADASELVKAGNEAVDRLANAIGAKFMIPPLMATVQPLLASGDWKCRRAALITISLSLQGCKRVLAPGAKGLVTQLLPFLKDPHPRVRHSALRFLEQISEDYMNPNEGEIEDSVNIDIATSKIAEHKGGGAARAASAAQAKLPGIFETAGDIMLPALIDAMGPENANIAPRLCGAAASALTCLLDEDTADLDIVQEHAPALIGALFQVLTLLNPATHMGSQGAALSAIASAASVLGEAFKHYYPQLMPPLKSLIATSPTSKVALRLRNRALECLSMVCEAVGKEVAGMDATECLNNLLMAEKAGFGDDDTESPEVFVDALFRIASCLGADFAPYLPFVIPMYAEKASSVVQVSIDSSNDDPDAAPAVSMDEAAFTSKHVGLRVLLGMVQTLGCHVPAMWPYIDGIASIAMKDVGHMIPDIRNQAVVCLSSCLSAAMADTTDLGHGQRVLNILLPLYAVRLGGSAADAFKSKEYALSQLYLLAEELEGALKGAWQSTQPGYEGPSELKEDRPTPAPGAPTPVYGQCIVDQAHIPALFRGIQFAFGASVVRRTIAAKFVTDNPDADDEDAEKLAQTLEAENEMLSHLTDSLGYIIKMHGPIVLSHLTVPIAPATVGLGQTMLGWMDRKGVWDVPLRACSICLADDLFEWGGPGALAIVPSVLPHLLECCASDKAQLRQPATYGLGVLAQHGGDPIAAHVPAIVSALQQCASVPENRTGDNAFATDNAVSALIKLAKFRGAPAVDVDGIMGAALAYLPFKQDAIEACLVHGWMVDGLGNMETLWIGNNGSRVPALMGALGRALAAHKANMESNSSAAAEADEDDEEGDNDEEELLEKRHIAALPLIAAGLAGGSHAAQMRAVLASLPQKERNALAHYGFRL